MNFFKIVKRVKFSFERLLRFLYLVLFGNSMLLLSAIAEYDRTEMSRRLIARYSEVPEMIEALMMSLLILTAVSFVYYCAVTETERG